MFSANVIALGVAALKGTETEQRICVLLYDDNFQVISSFELNQIASLTYHEGSLIGELDYTEKILEHVHTIVSKPLEYSPLSIEKALAVTKHILIFGATKAIRPFKSLLMKNIDALQQYNTALLAQQQTGAAGFLMRIKGGTVDKGGPVRELAATIIRLLSNDQVLLFERNTKADPNSLVPIGSKKEVSFVSDDARLRYLKKKMEHEKLMEQRSNLAKANDGFGAGYMSRDGKSVVGAAHGIDEMIRQAQKESQKFTDSGTKKTLEIDVDELRQYAQEFEQQYGGSAGQVQTPEIDLLALDSTSQNTDQFFSSTNQQVDLLDFGVTSSRSNNNNAILGDLLGVNSTTASSNMSNSGTTTDIFGFTSDPYAIQSAAPAAVTNTDVFGLDPYQSTSSATTIVTNGLGNLSLSASITPVNAASTVADPFCSPPIVSSEVVQPTTTTKSIMSSNEDKYSVFDQMEQSSGINNSVATSKPTGSAAHFSLGKDSFAGLGDIRPMNFSNSMNLTTNASGGLANLSNSLYGSTLSASTTAVNIADGLSNIGISSSLSTMTVPTLQPSADLSSIQVSQVPVPSGITDDDLASGFVMGGTTGSGLVPLAAAPASSPPPPPPPGPASYW